MKKIFRFSAFAPLIVLFLSLSFLILTWDKPGVNGDEFNFLWPLLTDPIASIGPFKWSYFGPLKTYLTYPVLMTMGFDVKLFRIISILAYSILSILLFGFFWKRRLFIAASVLIVFLSINVDLLHYAKSDRNASTFVLLTAVLMVLSLDRLYRKKGLIDFAIASIAILVALNTHLRNVWLLNSLLAAISIAIVVDVLNVYNFKSGHGDFWVRLRYGLLLNKLVFLSYGVGVIYFCCVYFYFRNSPETLWALKMGEGVDITSRIGNAISYLASGFSGADILSRPSTEYLPWQAGEPALTALIKYLAITFALIICACSIITILAKIRNKLLIADIEKFFIVSLVVFSLSAIQYLVTKTAALPYHHNIVVVSMLVCVSVSAEHVYRLGPFRYARGVSLVCVLGLYCSIAFNYVTYLRNTLQTPTNVAVIKSAVDVMKAKPAAQYILFDWFVGPAVGLTYKFDPCCLGDVRRVGAVAIYSGGLPTDSDSFVFRATELNDFYGITGLTDQQLSSHGQIFQPTHMLPVGFQFGTIKNTNNPSSEVAAR